MNANVLGFIQRALILTLLLLPSVVQAQDFTSNLVGHWALDDTSGSTITDEIGSNDGAWTDNVDDDVSGETTTGKIGSSIDLDGTDDQITITGLMGSPSVLTVSAWVNLTNGNIAGNGADIFSIGDAIAFRADNGSFGSMGFFHDGTTWRFIFSNIDIMGTGWRHMVYVADPGNSDQRLYLDGALIGSSSYSGAISYSGLGSDTKIGRHANGTANHDFGGMIDDVRVYDRALTTADIAALYAYTGENVTCANPDGFTGEMRFNNDLKVLQYCNGAQWVAIGQSSTLSEGLVGHWKLDETSGNTITDATGNSDGTWTDNADNTVSAETGAGTVSRALTFDGVDDYISIPQNASVNVTDTVTVSFWINAVPGSSAWSRVINKNTPGVATGFEIEQSSSSTGFHMRIDTALYNQEVGSINNVLDGTWHHVVYTLDNGIINGYLDGTLNVSEPYTHGAGFFNTENILLGDSQSLSAPLEGTLDDIRIYDRVMSAAEVTQIYNMQTSCTAPTTNLQGHWTLNETTGSSITDSAGSNTGTWADGSGNSVAEETVAAQDGTGITFDGVDDAINAGSDASIDDVFVGGGTVSAWIYPISTGGGTWGRILDKSQSTIANNGWAFQMDSGGNDIVFQVSCTSDRYAWTTNGSVTPFNQWSHVTITFDNSSITNAPTIYVNGSVVSTSRQLSCAGAFDVDAGSDLFIGNYQSGSRGFDGTIDDVRIYDRILTSSEIAENYGATGGICTGGKCTSPSASTGEIVFNTDVDAMQYCNGSNWIGMGPPGDGGAGICSSPAGRTAELRYNSDVNALQYCEGDEWIAVTGAPSTTIPTAGLVGHWTLDDTSGSTIVDSSASGLNGTWNDNVDNDVTGETTTGQVNTALTFDGTDDVISLGDNFDMPDDFTICAWTKPTGGTTGYIAGKVSSSANGYYFRANSGAAWEIGTSGSNFINVPGSMDFDTWQHLCAVVDPSPDTSTLYKNGVAIGTQTATPAAASNAIDFTIGNRADNARDFNGELDDVRIYNRALSATEVNNLYNATN